MTQNFDTENELRDTLVKLHLIAELMITGLLLGYPLESTVGCIFQ